MESHFLILNSGRSFKGFYFNTWHDHHHSILVKSFPKTSDLFSISHCPAIDSPLIAPACRNGSARNRYVYALPSDHKRLVDINIAHLDPKFSEIFARSVTESLEHIDKSDGGNGFAPKFCRFRHGAFIDGTLQACILQSVDLRQRLRSAKKLLNEGKSSKRLHGTLSVGNFLKSDDGKSARILYDNGTFQGPLEYDIATLMETFVDLINKRRLIQQSTDTLARFIDCVMKKIDKRMPLDHNALRDLTVYQYIGHLNMYQALIVNTKARPVSVSLYSGLIRSFIKTLDELV